MVLNLVVSLMFNLNCMCDLITTVLKFIAFMNYQTSSPVSTLSAAWGWCLKKDPSTHHAYLVKTDGRVNEYPVNSAVGGGGGATPRLAAAATGSGGLGGNSGANR
jgi:hypothetical protein